ncbi:pigment-dispersing hormone type 1-like [Panulirus ornatus]|uniref:pigment-dispersing hormone type 1-like n=1 Tax=Panulirus ornatus TaxID=150431 RepID=UPI003A88FD89
MEESRDCHHQVFTVLLSTHTLKMRSAVAVAMLVMLAMIIVLTQAQNLQYPEREVVAGLAAQILRVAHGPAGYPAVGPQKRNAELINSLLGIPKVMNDAGRR